MLGLNGMFGQINQDDANNAEQMEMLQAQMLQAAVASGLNANFQG